jgi:hypothetical protein
MRTEAYRACCAFEVQETLIGVKNRSMLCDMTQLENLLLWLSGGAWIIPGGAAKKRAALVSERRPA